MGDYVSTSVGTTPTSSPSVSSTGLQSANPPSDHDHALAHTHTYDLPNHSTYTVKDSGGSDQTIQLVNTVGAYAADWWTYEQVSDHSHTFSGSTSGGGASHSHTVSDHTHTVTIAAHNHTLSYGIFDDSTPSNPAITLTINGTDRTSALGGPWNTVGSEVELDVTTYLQDANGHPLRQSNTLVFGASVLCDVEALLRTLETAESLVPV